MVFAAPKILDSPTWIMPVVPAPITATESPVWITFSDGSQAAADWFDQGSFFKSNSLGKHQSVQLKVLGRDLEILCEPARFDVCVMELLAQSVIAVFAVVTC
jgi:hypothetical protein